MPTLTELTTNLDAQVFTGLTKVQDVIVDGVQAFADRFAPYAAQLPTAPWAERVPAATDVAERVFTYAEKLVNSQRDFAERLLDAAAPLFANTSVKPAVKAKTAPKAKPAQAA